MIRELIRESDAVIVDLSEAKPNVLYEIGYAHGLSKPCVHVCSTPLSGLPFDVRNWNTIEYTRGQTTKLRAPLAKRLEAVLSE
jgi:nucleoside 2-deoxyribosyltransferase